MKRGAAIDPTGPYRYSLWREWDANAPQVGFVMLNSSKADAVQDDPTLRRCIRFAQTWGYGSLQVVNLFALIATQARELYQASDPIGRDNDRYLLKASIEAQTLIVAWGNLGTFQGRNRAVLDLLLSQAPFYCLGTTQAGHPRHPLYIKSNKVPVLFQSTDLRARQFLS